MIKVNCNKCNQSRKATSNKAHYIRLEHSFNNIIMQRDDKGRWECCNGFGCAKTKK